MKKTKIAFFSFFGFQKIKDWLWFTIYINRNLDLNPEFKRSFNDGKWLWTVFSYLKSICPGITSKHQCAYICVEPPISGKSRPWRRVLRTIFVQNVCVDFKKSSFSAAKNQNVICCLRLTVSSQPELFIHPFSGARVWYARYFKVFKMNSS